MAGRRWQVAGGRWQVAGRRWQVAGGRDLAAEIWQRRFGFGRPVDVRADEPTGAPRRSTWLATVGLLVARHNATLIAQDPTPLLTKDVAPIFSQNCTTCHRPGGLGSFSLMSYDSVKTYIDELRDAVPRAPCHRGTPRASTVRSRMTNG